MIEQGSTRLHRQGRFLRCLLAALALCAPAVPQACDDPDLHPELAAFHALQESLREQPRGALEIKYKVDNNIGVTMPSAVRLWFWPNESYDEATFTVTPSPGLRLVDTPAMLEVPFKGTSEISVRAIRPGHHHLKIETIVRQDGIEHRRVFALAVPVEVDHLDRSAAAGAKAFGFAGPRLQQAIGRTPPAASDE
ncbi:MAG: hypothetical protein K9L70_05765 [Thiohalocapsa sp.]|nr:hypothetical protein [Thiohalocapsa sp.]MCF7989623.1 hypothetical protein [Thiohalocapsa sp.]